MIKHVGKHNNKRCIILWRKVPNEDHMALVVYPDLMARHIHDDIMKYLESESGQQSDQFSDYLFRVNLSDGENALTKLHKEGMIKKVPTNQVIVTPNNKSTVRLDELNSILDKMAVGEEAVKEMAELDSKSGMQTKRSNVKEVGVPRNSRSAPVEVVNENISINDVLSDEQLATQRLAQAQKMQADARALLAEADRLQKEAMTLTGSDKDGTTKTKKTRQAKAA